MDETTKAPTLLCTIVTDRGVSWAQAVDMLRPPENGVIDLEASSSAGAVLSSSDAQHSSLWNCGLPLPLLGKAVQALNPNL